MESGMKKLYFLTGAAILLTGCIPPSHMESESKLNEIAASQAEIKAENNMTNDAILSELQEIKARQANTDELLAQIKELKAQNGRLLKEIAQFRTAQNTTVKTAETVQPEGSSKEIVYNSKPSDKKAPDGKLIAGSEEWCLLEDFEIAMLARIDTGATTSGINATNIEAFERDGKKWYRFDLPDLNGNLHHLEGAFVRRADVVQSSNVKDTHERPVVLLKLTLGDITKKAEFTLADRSHMNYGLLLGREFMKDDVLVDIGKERIQAKPSAAVYIGKKVKEQEAGEKKKGAK